MKFLLILLTFFSLSITAVAQKGKIEGKVTDAKTSGKISSATIEVVNTKTIVVTDVDGNFTLQLPAGKYSLRISSIGYQPKIIDDVDVAVNGSVNVDIILDVASKTEANVEVRSSARRETINSLIAFQKNTNTVAQVISAEAIKRSPDKNTGDVLKRVPGTSIQEGKYLVVRGLADRYNQAMLNGILLSSTEPDRKTFSFDIIPAAMIDNIIINKAFIPELPGEWAGGLIQVNTKDVPAKNFLSVQVGTGFNTQTIGKDFYSYKGSSTDFLGYDNGTRALPVNLPLKAGFASLTQAEKTAYAKDFKNIWTADKDNGSLLNQSFIINGGFNMKLGKKNKLAAIFALNYNRSNKRIEYHNEINTFDQNNVPSLSFDYSNLKYAKDILAGALANITVQLGNNNKITFKNILNVNTSNYSTLRSGRDIDGATDPAGDNIKATELGFKANTFFTTQLSGDHNIKKYNAKFHWFGSFNILDQYVPDQRRLQYTQLVTADPTSPYQAAIGQSKSSQKSGSRYYGFLNDYIYTAGADVSKSFTLFKQAQTIKGGYFFQVKDRLFDSRPFAIYLPSGNDPLKLLPADQIFAPENFGNGTDNKFALNELAGDSYRYIANSILNAGFLQFDNQFGNKLRVLWGLRVEDFDQVIGSMKKTDSRHVYSRVRDYLPGLNLTYKLNPKTNVRVSASQTVIRPEFRELSTFQFYDFDLGATVAGFTGLVRTKVSNFDLRYELYPRAGELFTIGMFYKYFKNPIEAFFNPSSGGASTYNFINADEANSFGAELDFRKKLDFNTALKNFTVQGNVSYIYNRVTSKNASLNRPMQGQSPYLLNAGIQYDLEKQGISTTLLFNQIGRRIAFVGGGDDDTHKAPAVWENPRPVLDLQVAKKILKNKGELKMNVADIFNRKAIFYNDLNNNKKYDSDTDRAAIIRSNGTTFSFSFGYNF